MKSFTELSTEIKKREREQEKLDKEQRREDKQKIKFKADEEKVVSGVVAPREPIDKKAALLVSPAPWYAHAPQQPRREPQPEPKKPRPRRKKIMAEERHQVPPTVNENDKIRLSELAVKVAAEIERNTPKEMSAIAKSALNAREALDDSVRGIGNIMADFDAVATKAKESIRNNRYNIVSEAASITKPLKEIRQFFLGPDYETERNRLKEFVELCERLQQLKESGFLDSVADTLLTLNAGSHGG